MIDEKTIVQAANEYNPDINAFARKEKAAFAAGVEWFKKALWHTEDEIPESDRLILVKGWKSKDGCFALDTTKELYLKDFDGEIQWENFCKFADFAFTWCYIDDLFPNKQI